MRKISQNNLVIFDCDGVLVDSEALAAQVFSDTLAEHGIGLSAQQCLGHFKGLTLSSCLEKLTGQLQYQLPSDFLTVLNERTAERFSHELQPVEGIHELLATLKQKGIEFCVASNGGADKTRHSLGVSRLADFFGSRVFSAEQVSAGKPSPELFQLAARTMGFEAQQCWVIEDSSTGVQAANKANMPVAYYAPVGGLDELQSLGGKVQLHINALSQLQQLII